MKIKKVPCKQAFVESENLPLLGVDASIASNSKELDMYASFLKSEPNFEPIPEADEQVVGAIFKEWQHNEDDDDISWLGSMPSPMVSSSLQIKANDKLSANMPFVTNVSKILLTSYWRKHIDKLFSISEGCW